MTAVRDGETCNRPRNGLRTACIVPRPGETWQDVYRRVAGPCGNPAVGAQEFGIDGQTVRIAWCIVHAPCGCPEEGHFEDCRIERERRWRTA